MRDIIQAGPNLAAYPTDARNLDQILAWNRGAAAADAALRTQQVYDHYVTESFGNWKVSYDASRAEEPPPNPPFGFEAQLTDDGLGWDLIQRSVFAGPVPPYTKRKVITNTGGFGQLTSAGGSRALLFAPVGGQATQADGTVWQRIR